MRRCVPEWPEEPPARSWTEFAGSSTPIWRTPSGHWPTSRPHVNLFVQSFVILLREGFEAILLVGALMTFLAKMGAAHRKRDIHIGVGAAAAASLLTAFALETIFHLTSAKREALEGLTMALATVVLFYVSYWLLSKMEVAKWNHFVKSKVQDALTSGSGLALASAAFLAVYREGFETVLFYKALFVTGGSPAATMPILAGILLGSLVMVGGLPGHQPVRPAASVEALLRGDQRIPVLHGICFCRESCGRATGGGLISTTIVVGAPRAPCAGYLPHRRVAAGAGGPGRSSHPGPCLDLSHRAPSSPSGWITATRAAPPGTAASDPCPCSPGGKPGAAPLSRADGGGLERDALRSRADEGKPHRRA